MRNYIKNFFNRHILTAKLMEVGICTFKKQAIRIHYLKSDLFGLE